MTSCEDLSAKYSEVSNAISELSSAINGLDIPDITDLKKQIQGLKSDLDGVKRQARTASVSAESAKQKAIKALSEIFILGGTVSTLNSELLGIGKNVSVLKTDTQSLFRRTGDLAVDISHIGDTAGSAKNLAKKATTEISNLNGEVRKVGQLAGSASTTAKKAVGEITNLGGKVAGIFSLLAGFATLVALAALQAQINDVKSTANEGRRTARQALSLAGEVEQALNSFEGYIKRQLRLTEEALNSKINKAKDQAIRRAQGLYNLLKGELSRVEAKIQKVKTELLSRIEDVFNYVDSKIESLLSKIEKLSSLIQRIESSLKEYINSRSQELLSRIEKVSSLIQRIESSLKEYVNSRFQELLSRIEKVSSLIQRIESSLKEYVNNRFQELLSRIEKVSSLIQRIESSLKEYVNSRFQELLSRIENLKSFLQSQLSTIIAGAAAIALASLLAKLPGLIAKNMPSLPCRFNDVAAREAATTAKRHEQKFNIFQKFVQATMWVDIKKSFNGVFERLGDVLPNGGIAGKIVRMAKNSLWDKAMSALNTWILLHNAFMLSSSLMQTLGETLSTGLSVIGIRDDDDNPIDVNRVLGKTADDMVSSIIGSARWEELKQTLAAANRIYQSASNIIFTLRSISDSSLAIGQWTAEQLAKIGNGLKADGLVSRLAYPWMPETVLPQNAILQRLENLDDAASSLNMVVNEVKSIQDEAAELANQKEEFGKEIDKFKKQKEDLAKAWDDDSESPDIPVDQLKKSEID